MFYHMAFTSLPFCVSNSFHISMASLLSLESSATSSLSARRSHLHLLPVYWLCSSILN